MSTQNQIIVTIPEGHIHYLEHRNMWAAIREGATVAEKSSLAEAKEALEKLVEREEAKNSPFKRHDAFLCEYNYQQPRRVTVTSYASENEAWVRNPEGRRSKERFDKLRAASPANEAKLAEIEAHQAVIDEARKKCQEIGKTLSPYKRVS